MKWRMVRNIAVGVCLIGSAIANSHQLIVRILAWWFLALACLALTVTLWRGKFFYQAHHPITRNGSPKEYWTGLGAFIAVAGVAVLVLLMGTMKT